jgi:hypothetical protein
MCSTPAALANLDRRGFSSTGGWVPKVGARRALRPTDHGRDATKRRCEMVALIVLLLILAVFGGLGFAAHVLWFVLIAAVVLWLLGFLVGTASGGIGAGRRGWYRW